jgi:hypothetical protein
MLQMPKTGHGMEVGGAGRPFDYWFLCKGRDRMSLSMKIVRERSHRSTIQ